MFMFHVMKIVRVNLDGKKPCHARARESAMCRLAREFSFVLFLRWHLAYFNGFSLHGIITSYVINHV